MARGWESKSVEEQQTGEFNRRAAQPSPVSDREQQRDALLLQCKRIRGLIDSSTNPRYVEQQEKALGFLEAQLRSLE